jgi:MFS family permease
MRDKWSVVTSVATVGFVIAGTCAGVIGAISGPLMQEMGWSNGRTSSLATGYTLGSLLSTPAVGAALDRLGARAVMSCGALVTSLGFLLATYSRSWTSMLIAFTSVGIGLSASFYLPGAVVVANWMKTQRSLGMGIVMGVMSAGAAIFAPITSWSTEKYGWRLTLDGIAVLIAVMLPLIWMFVRTYPFGEAPSENAPSEGLDRLSVRRDLVSPVFLLATASGVLFSVGMAGIYFHVVPLLIKAGYSAYWAGLAFGGTWLLSGAGSLVLGVTADHFGAKQVLAAALLSGALGTLFLLAAGTGATGVASILVFVLLWGASANSFGQLAPVILAERFGSTHLGTLIGVQFAISGSAAAAAPVATGLLYDRFGDYRAAILLSASASLMSVVLILLLNGRQRKGRSVVEEKSEAPC